MFSFLNRSIRFAVLACVILHAANVPIVLSQPKAIALVGATVIPVTETGMISDAVVLIRDGKLTFVGPAYDAPDLEGFLVLDTSGKWIIPGLIDTNVHLILTTVPEFYIKYEDRLEEIAVQSAQVGLKYGLTTMMDSWGPLNPLLRARDRIRSGDIVGSRVLIAGNIVGLGGPFSPYFMGSWDIRGKSLRYGGWVHPSIRKRIDTLWEAGVGPELMAMTPGEVGSAVSDYIHRGIDFLKVAVSGHGIEPVEPLMFSPEVLEIMRGEAAAADIPFQTHTFTIESLRLAVDLKPDLLQHPNVMSRSWNAMTDREKEAVRKLITRIRSGNILSGLMAIPEKHQLAVYQSWKNGAEDTDPWLDEIMHYRKPWFEGATYDDMAAGIKVWLAAGVPYTLATDAGPEASDLGPTVWGRLGRAHFDRMIALQDAGAGPMDILRAATINGATAYRIDGLTGSLEIGKSADLVVLDADPLQDIGNVRRINMVVMEGRIIDREALPVNPVLNYDPEASWPY